MVQHKINWDKVKEIKDAAEEIYNKSYNYFDFNFDEFYKSKKKNIQNSAYYGNLLLLAIYGRETGDYQSHRRIPNDYTSLNLHEALEFDDYAVNEMAQLFINYNAIPFGWYKVHDLHDLYKIVRKILELQKSPMLLSSLQDLCSNYIRHIYSDRQKDYTFYDYLKSGEFTKFVQKLLCENPRSINIWYADRETASEEYKDFFYKMYSGKLGEKDARSLWSHIVPFQSSINDNVKKEVLKELHSNWKLSKFLLNPNCDDDNNREEYQEVALSAMINDLV